MTLFLIVTVFLVSSVTAEPPAVVNATALNNTYTASGYCQSGIVAFLWQDLQVVLTAAPSSTTKFFVNVTATDAGVNAALGTFDAGTGIVSVSALTGDDSTEQWSCNGVAQVLEQVYQFVLLSGGRSGILRNCRQMHGN
jgi:hypothetical protein